jgi:hypothetical protein
VTAPKRMAAIAERVAKATRGPWSVNQHEDSYTCDVLDAGSHEVALLEANYDEQDVYDAAFIAAAREDVPWLLEQLQTARALLADAVEHMHETWCDAEQCRCGRYAAFLEATDAE